MQEDDSTKQRLFGAWSLCLKASTDGGIRTHVDSTASWGELTALITWPLQPALRCVWISLSSSSMRCVEETIGWLWAIGTVADQKRHDVMVIGHMWLKWWKAKNEMPLRWNVVWNVSKEICVWEQNFTFILRILLRVAFLGTVKNQEMEGICIIYRVS